MISYKEACEIVGYNQSTICPEKKIVYLAYKGKTIKEFTNLSDAKKFGKFLEKKCLNQNEIDNFIMDQKKKENQSKDKFLYEFRKDYPELSDCQFTSIWNKAWEDAHSYGYDEVALKFKDIYNFYRELSK